MPLAEIVPPLADHFTLVLLVPLMVAENCSLLPACSAMEAGETPMVTTGGGATGAADTILNSSWFDCFPVSGLNITTYLEPALEMSAEEMATVALPVLSTVVGRWAPFHSTTHSLQKFIPLRAMVNSASPAVALAGESEIKMGLRDGLVPSGGAIVIC